MGYRSDVEIAVYGPEDVMTAFIAGQRIKTAKWLADKHTVKTIYINKDAEPYTLINASFQCVKWYETYEDVCWWEDLLADARDQDGMGICTEFVRIGEDAEDNHAEYSGDECGYFLSIAREIYADFPSKDNQE
jgi:hypothetical protein